jgi:two-component system, NarL family, response regulator NreC
VSIRILIADDHQIVLDGLRLLLETKEDIKVVGEAVHGREAVHKTIQFKPDIVTMDIAMSELNGIEATRQIHELSPATRVIILSMHATAEYINRALKAGACGYLLKESTGIELIDAVRTVYAGRRYVSQKISDILIDDYVYHHAESLSDDPLECLSPREREILQLVAEGKSSAQIANIIFLSPKTVETYRSRLMQKLGIKNFADLIKFAVQKGLIPLE